MCQGRDMRARCSTVGAGGVLGGTIAGAVDASDGAGDVGGASDVSLAGTAGAGDATGSGDGDAVSGGEDCGAGDDDCANARHGRDEASAAVHNTRAQRNWFMVRLLGGREARFTPDIQVH